MIQITAMPTVGSLMAEFGLLFRGLKLFVRNGRAYAVGLPVVIAPLLHKGADGNAARAVFINHVPIWAVHCRLSVQGQRVSYGGTIYGALITPLPRPHGIHIFFPANFL